MKKFVLNLFFCLTLLVTLLGPSLVYAEEAGEVKAAVAVGATVPSKICPQYSSFVTNVTEILSDASQKALFTVHIKDCGQVELANTPLAITSNRGALDKLHVVDSIGNVIDTGDGLGLQGSTDANGFIFFQAYSNIPGEAIFSASGDNMVDLGQIKITFLPLPFPKNISVVAEVPKIISPSGLITLFKPKDYDVDRDKLVNLTMELRIPAWVFYVFILIIFLNTAMFSSIMALVFKIRAMQKVEIEHIEQEEEILKKEEQEIEKLAEKDSGR
jgi:hypothetical protein